MCARIIAIVNQKGGVAKTTTAFNLGARLVQKGYEVLAVDCDPQASLTNAMGIAHPDKLTNTLTEAMMAEINDETYPQEYGIQRHEEGIELFPSNITLSGVELSLFNAMNREYILRNVLEKVRSDYDYILLDCSPSLGLMTINALAAANIVIIPCQPGYLESKGLDLLLGSAKKVIRRINPNLCIGGILFTMVDRRTNNAKDIIGYFRNEVGEHIRVFETEIPRSVRAAEASQAGQSIFAYDKDGKVAKTYAEFAEEVLDLERETYRSRDDGAR